MANLHQSPNPAPLLISTNTSWNIVNFREGLVRSLIEQGFRVAVAAGDADHQRAIEALGATFHRVPMDSSGLTPMRDSATLFAYWRLMRRLRPAAFLGFTAKPNVYGAIAAHLVGVPVVANISGLGIGFRKPGLLQKTMLLLYRLSLGRAAVVFFQNPDDRRTFVDKRLVHEDQARLINGSGVNLAHFKRGSVRSDQPFHAVMIARMIWAKGVGEYVGAARRIRETMSDTRFTLVGPAGVNNPDAVSAEQLHEWARDGIIDYLGSTDDVRPFIDQADCVVLPSYYPEGVPRSLIEGAAMGRPIITTDEPGCREIVRDGVTGLLCTARSSESLEAALRRMISFTRERRRQMGEEGRRLVEERFSEELVVDAYLSELDRIAGAARSGTER